MSVLDKDQRCLQSFELSHSVRLCYKLLDQAQVLPPLWTLLIVYPLEQFHSLFVSVQTGFPHLRRSHEEATRRNDER